MFSEYDVVRLLSATAAPGLPMGTCGIIQMIHDATPPEYEVEFVDDAGDFLGLFTLREGDLDWVSKA